MHWTDWIPLDSTGLHWTLTGLHWTLTGLLVHWTGTGLSKWLVVQWESSGLGIAPANLAWQEGHWNPLESTWITWGRVKTSLRLNMCLLKSNLSRPRLILHAHTHSHRIH
jgi:hypothetical protein